MTGDSASFDAGGRLLAQQPPGDNAPAMSISELSGALKRTVEDRFGFVRVRGEISGFKRAASGHLYLALKDENAVIDGVMWKGGAQKLAFRPEDGIEVIATGRITTYPARSKYQIVIESMEIAGEGALMQLFERLKQKLNAEGLFDRARKRPLPFMPRTIGIVTSPTGAVIRDILHRLADRCPTRVIVWPVLVQGEGAAAQVAQAVRGFDAIQPGGPIPRPDLVIVARGGGSIEDLWSFNEEIVVRAVAGCSIPTISAVGHETDTTLCDYAADLRAPTPTAAAEIAVPVRAELLAMLGEHGARMQRCVSRGMERCRERLDAQARLLPAPDRLLTPQMQRVDDLSDRLRRGLSHRLSDARGELAKATGALRPAVLRQRLNREQERLARTRLRPALIERSAADLRDRFDRLARLLVSLDPDRPLARGFARVMADGHLVRDVSAARAAGAVTLKFADGEVGARIDGGHAAALEKGGVSPISSPSRTKRQSREQEAPAGQQDLFS